MSRYALFLTILVAHVATGKTEQLTRNVTDEETEEASRSKLMRNVTDEETEEASRSKLVRGEQTRQADVSRSPDLERWWFFLGTCYALLCFLKVLPKMSTRLKDMHAYVRIYITDCADGPEEGTSSGRFSSFSIFMWKILRTVMYEDSFQKCVDDCKEKFTKCSCKGGNAPEVKEEVRASIEEGRNSLLQSANQVQKDFDHALNSAVDAPKKEIKEFVSKIKKEKDEFAKTMLGDLRDFLLSELRGNEKYERGVYQILEADEERGVRILEKKAPAADEGTQGDTAADQDPPKPSRWKPRFRIKMPRLRRRNAGKEKTSTSSCPSADDQNATAMPSVGTDQMPEVENAEEPEFFGLEVGEEVMVEDIEDDHDPICGWIQLSDETRGKIILKNGRKEHAKNIARDENVVLRGISAAITQGLAPALIFVFAYSAYFGNWYMFKATHLGKPVAYVAREMMSHPFEAGCQLASMDERNFEKCEGLLQALAKNGSTARAQIVESWNKAGCDSNEAVTLNAIASDRLLPNHGILLHTEVGALFAQVGLLLKIAALFLTPQGGQIFEFCANAALGLFTTIEFDQQCLVYHNMFEDIFPFLPGFMPWYLTSLKFMGVLRSISKGLVDFATWPVELAKWVLKLLFFNKESPVSFSMTTSWTRKGCQLKWYAILSCPMGCGFTLLHFVFVAALFVILSLLFFALTFPSAAISFVCVALPLVLLSNFLLLEIFGIFPVLNTIFIQMNGQLAMKLTAIATTLNTIDYLLNNSVVFRALCSFAHVAPHSQRKEQPAMGRPSSLLVGDGARETRRDERKDPDGLGRGYSSVSNSEH